MDTEKRKRFIINFVFFSIIAAILYFSLNYLVIWLLPFIIGFLLAYLMNPAISWLVRKTPFNRKFLAYFFTITLAVILGLLVWLAGYLLVNLITDYFYLLPNIFTQQIEPVLRDFNSWLNNFIEGFDPAVAAELNQLQSNLLVELQNLAINLSKDGLVMLTNLTRSLPTIMISFIFTILATIFTNIDFPVVKDFLFSHMPKKFAILIKNIRVTFVETIGKYLTAYLKIMSITFVELSIGFFIVGIPNPLLVALLIAIFDILPVLGTGGVMVPWVIFMLITGNIHLAIGLAIIYVVVTVVRQFVEPKIVGDQLGLDPLVTLVSIYLGFIWFGVAGMLLVPISTNIFINLYSQGKLKQFINFEELYKEDFEPEDASVKPSVLRSLKNRASRKK